MGYFTAIFRPRLRVGFAELIALAVLVALAIVVYRYSPTVFWLTAVGASVANLVGWLAGWFVTHVWGLPNDGSDPLSETSE